MDREKIVLIDGHSILNRAFYGIPDLTNGEGLHTNAVYGFLNILFRILDEEKPAYLAVAFDLKAPTFRHKMYAAYKGTRSPMPDELRQQVPVMKEMLTAMGVPLMMLEGFEADDLLGTVSLAMEEKGLDVTILSGDRDLLQLSSEHTLIRIPKTKRGGTEIEDYRPVDVLEKYQVNPVQIIELKALMGDASDNIPGIPGVGEKTAAKLIVQFGSIEEAYAHVEEVKPNKAKLSLSEHYDLAVLSKQLATIDRKAPFELDLEKARLGNLYTEEARQLCKRLEFKAMLSRFSKQEEETAKSDYRFCDSLEEAEEVFSVLSKQESFGFKLFSTESLRKNKDSLMALALSWETEKERNVVCICVGGFLTPAYLAGKLNDLAGKAIACTLDLKEQLFILPALTPEKSFDAAIAAYLLNPLKNSYTYDDIAKDCLSESFPAKEELFGKKEPDPDTDEEKFLKYLCGQAEVALCARVPMLKELENQGMKGLFEQIEMPLVFTLMHMEQEGIAVRGEELKNYGEQLTGRILELEETIYQEAGETFNILSPKQLGTILFEKLKLPYGKKTKTGYSTAADVLEKLAEEYPFVREILEYRQLTKLKSTYAEGLYAFIEEDGRIHGRFLQTVTATGRLSSADPNLQNIPVRTQLGRELRKVFVPKDGYVFVDADYSQIELRVLAHASKDEKLIEAYHTAQDIHAITASNVFHIPLEKVTSQERRNAKAVNFGIVYGISSFGLSQGLSITRKEAQEYIEKYFEAYPGIKKFLDESVSEAKENGYSVTLFGRRRPIPELKSANFMQRSFGERVAMNAPIQGTAADIIKIAMLRVDERLRKEGFSSRLLLQVHDELLIEAKQSEAEAVKRILKEEMMGAADLLVDLEIDMHDGGNWYDAK